MTEENMKKLYEFFRDGKNEDGVVIPPQPEKAQRILNIERYAHFKEKISEKETKPKKVK